jgi:hypothetical protein
MSGLDWTGTCECGVTSDGIKKEYYTCFGIKHLIPSHPLSFFFPGYNPTHSINAPHNIITTTYPNTTHLNFLKKTKHKSTLAGTIHAVVVDDS